MKIWDRAEIELATPESAVRQVSAVRHVTDCPTWPSIPVSIKAAKFNGNQIKLFVYIGETVMWFISKFHEIKVSSITIVNASPFIAPSNYM